MVRYETVTAKSWKNTRTGATASIYGAVPYTNSKDEPDWEIIDVGFTVRDNKTMRVGIGKPPYETKAEADRVADRLNKMGGS